MYSSPFTRFKFLDFNEYTDDNGVEQSTEDIPHHSDSSSHESLPAPSSTGSDKQVNIPVISYSKAKSHSPLLQSQRTNSESFLAHPRDHAPSTLGLSRALSSSHSGTLSLTNGFSPKDYQERISGHYRSKSSGSSSGDSDTGHAPNSLKRDAGPLSSSSLPPDGMRRLTAAARRKSSKDSEPITISYQETA